MSPSATLKWTTTNNKDRKMKNQYKLRGYNGLFFVKGKGFSSCEKDASILTSTNISCLADAGFTGTSVEVKDTSYAVVYIRKGEGVNLLAGGKKNQADANKGQIDPSKRRFLTEDEAWQHGSRARVRKANAGDKPGTAGHEGFFVISTTDQVNSVINWKSGLTNPIK